jgi:hypothetical protein
MERHQQKSINGYLIIEDEGEQFDDCMDDENFSVDDKTKKQLDKNIKIDFCYNFNNFDPQDKKFIELDAQWYPKIQIMRVDIIKDTVLSHNEYQIEIDLAPKNLPHISVTKRFSDFVNLYHELCQDLDLFGNIIPMHPSKNMQIYLWGDHEEFETDRKNS